ncbi:uncharacterized protein LOC121974702 [Zingiber officinale]|uniref:uncharacterized protein LOC121969569 n=1 Tax=Zingiber officinale TaxID=94328 RepID=UPI001C4BA8FB|nr:uncharacterized protein LOC121969569 [Zingiber officinale]XP_042381809.1 uncharacterized protein LOC121974702 [Zingiber officinale]
MHAGTSLPVSAELEPYLISDLSREELGIYSGGDALTWVSVAAKAERYSGKSEACITCVSRNARAPLRAAQFAACINLIHCASGSGRWFLYLFHVMAAGLQAAFVHVLFFHAL